MTTCVNWCRHMTPMKTVWIKDYFYSDYQSFVWGSACETEHYKQKHRIFC